MSTPRRLHIGHHFFGSGNIGDDMMLAGFLHAIGQEVELTCCSNCDVDSQRRRFPRVQWLPYTMEARAAAVRACDAWVGVGDTPFQLSVGTWFLDHLSGEADLCRAAGKPMYFVGVGVSEVGALEDERGRAVLDYATRVWARDPYSAEALALACAPGKVHLGADLAHLCLRALPPPAAPEAGVIGYVLNFEDPHQFRREALCAFVEAQPPERFQRWLVQEVRPLEGSEMEIWANLPGRCRQYLDLRKPDYHMAGTVQALLEPWGTPAQVVSSRYHAALVSAWNGSRVVAVERSGKVKGLAAELGLASLHALHDADEVRAALDRAAPVSRALLNSLADRAAAGCAELLAAV
jgi:hypothetical protein